MFDFLNRFGLPVKYALAGVLGGLIWLLVANLAGLAHGGVATLIALAIGGYVGGMIRKRQGKEK